MPHIFFFPEKSKMAAQIGCFWWFFTFERVLYSHGSHFLHKCGALYQNPQNVHSQCVIYGKNSRWPPKRVDLGVFFPFESASHPSGSLFLPQMSISLERPTKPTHRIFSYSGKFKMAAKTAYFWQFFLFLEF